MQTNSTIQTNLTEFLRGYVRTSGEGLELLFLIEWRERAQSEQKRREYRLIESMPDDLLDAVANGKAQIPTAVAGLMKPADKSATATTSKVETDEVLAAIASRVLGIKTLFAQNSDRLDFHDVHVDSLRLALREAFEAGLRA